MKKTILVALIALMALGLTGLAMAQEGDGDGPMVCRDTAEEIQCEIAANAAYQQCLNSAGGDPDLEFVCFLDWRETRQACDAIPPRCEINIP